MPSERGLSVSVRPEEHPLAVFTAPPTVASSPQSAAEASPPLLPVVRSPLADPQVMPTPGPVTPARSPHNYVTAPRLGFPPSARKEVVASEVRSRPRLDLEERQRERMWHAACRGVSLLASASPESIEALRGTARRHGIPAHLRRIMWPTLTGAASKVEENEYYCQTLLRTNGYVGGAYGRAIASDLERTFPRHPYFSSSDVGLCKLKNVLHAMCWRNPLLCYCQSFNYLCGFLLLVVDDEEQVLWLLTHVLENLLPNDFYGESLLGARIDQVVLETLVRRRLPKLAIFFDQISLEAGVVLPAWVMSLFVNTFPVETTLRVWDYILTDSPDLTQKTSAHLEIVLAVFQMHEPGLLQRQNSGDLMQWLNEQTMQLYDSTRLILTAREMRVSQSELHALRRSVRPQVVLSMRRHQELLEANRERRSTLNAQLEHRGRHIENVPGAFETASIPYSESVGPASMVAGTLGALPLPRTPQSCHKDTTEFEMEER